MRFYAIQISGGVAQSNLSLIPGLANITAQTLTTFTGQFVPTSISPIVGAEINGAQWCSAVNGVNDPGALDIEIDIQITPDGYLLAGWIKIYGIPQSLIAQSSYFIGCQLSIWGGFFSPSLPLAELEVPHTGLLCNALIWPCMGNWIGNQLSITFFLKPSTGNPGGPTAPINIIHNMPKGTTLSAAVKNALSTAFPNIPVNINISNSLILNYDDHGYYQSVEQYQNYVKALSHSILGTPSTTNYHGVRFDPSKGPFNVFDGTSPTGAVQILFEDLIGQPTWIDAFKIQIITALRSDIQPNMQIILPTNILVTTTEAGAYRFLLGPTKESDILNFQGTFDVIAVRHMGRFRNPDASSNWVTVIEAIVPGSVGAGNFVSNQSGQQIFINQPGGPGTSR